MKKFTLQRVEYGPQGIFSVFTDENGVEVGHCLEHAYPDGANWVPKVAAGVYTCVRHNGRLPYETFMLEQVPDFQGKPVSGILLHRGNFDKDSIGCILVGEKEVVANGTEMVTNSKNTFQRWMDSIVGENSIQLTILDAAVVAPAA